MKKIAAITIALMLVCGVAWADRGSLSTPVPLSVPTATSFEINAMTFDLTHKTITVTYRWIAADGSPIRREGTNLKDYTATIRDISGEPVADCIEVGKPYECCEGLATGKTCVEANPAFTSVFSAEVSAGDVGKSGGTGKLLRDRVVVELKKQIPELAGQTITFAE